MSVFQCFSLLFSPLMRAAGVLPILAVFAAGLLSSTSAYGDTFYLTANANQAGGYSGTGTANVTGVSSTGISVISSVGSQGTGGGGTGICNAGDPLCGSGGGGGNSNLFQFDITLSDGMNVFEFTKQDLTADASFTFDNGVLTGASINALDASGARLIIGSNLAYEVVYNNVGLYGKLTSSLTAPLDPGTPGASAVTPEPSSLFLLVTGLLGTAAVRRRYSGA